MTVVRLNSASKSFGDGLLRTIWGVLQETSPDITRAPPTPLVKCNLNLNQMKDNVWRTVCAAHGLFYVMFFIGRIARGYTAGTAFTQWSIFLSWCFASIDIKFSIAYLCRNVTFRLVWTKLDAFSATFTDLYRLSSIWGTFWEQWRLLTTLFPQWTNGTLLYDHRQCVYVDDGNKWCGHLQPVATLASLLVMMDLRVVRLCDRKKMIKMT